MKKEDVREGERGGEGGEDMEWGGRGEGMNEAGREEGRKGGNE